MLKTYILDSIVVSIPACHAGDQGSIPCRGAFFIIIINLLVIVRHNCFYIGTCLRSSVVRALVL